MTNKLSPERAVHFAITYLPPDPLLPTPNTGRTPLTAVRWWLPKWFMSFFAFFFSTFFLLLLLFLVELVTSSLRSVKISNDRKCFNNNNNNYNTWTTTNKKKTKFFRIFHFFFIKNIACKHEYVVAFSLCCISLRFVTSLRCGSHTIIQWCANNERRECYDEKKEEKKKYLRFAQQIIQVVTAWC